MNILFITFDQWRADSWSGMGHRAVSTPHIDDLARHAVTFRNHFTAATPCGPSRASLHTGMHAANHRSITNGTPLGDQHASWADCLQDHGYDPVLFGYTDTSADPRGLPGDDQRLTTYEGVLPGIQAELVLPEDLVAWRAHLKDHGYGDLSNEDIYTCRLGEPARFQAEHSETAFVAGQFLTWLNAQPAKQTKPWCAHVSFVKPHPPFVAAAPYNDCVDIDKIAGPIGFQDDSSGAIAKQSCAKLEHPFVNALLAKPIGHDEKDRLGPTPNDLTDQKIRKMRQVYYGLITELDHHLGKILETLKTRGEFDNTLIILTADHGEMLGDFGLLGKAGPFEQAYHVPLIIRDPRHHQHHGNKVDAFTSHVDIAPTLIAAGGGTPPLQCDGHDLGSYLRGQKPSHWRQGLLIEHHFGELSNSYYQDALNLEFSDCGFAVWLERDWLIAVFANLPSILIDRQNDLLWQHNQLVHKPEIAAGMLERMARYRMQINDWRLAKCQLTPNGLIGRFDVPPNRPNTI